MYGQLLEAVYKYVQQYSFIHSLIDDNVKKDVGDVVVAVVEDVDELRTLKKHVCLC